MATVVIYVQGRTHTEQQRATCAHGGSAEGRFDSDHKTVLRGRVVLQKSAAFSQMRRLIGMIPLETPVTSRATQDARTFRNREFGEFAF